ncbi:MAG: DUF1592 domain-containing protein [Marinagarivorans sp.]|nr:DUF1592 domain-containing protein [Marinagarivorans sp.]
MPSSNLSFNSLAATISRPDGGFSNLASQKVASSPHVKELVALADNFAAELVLRRGSFHSCLSGNSFDKPCVTAFLNDFLTRAFRRPADAELVNHFASFFAEQARQGESLDAFRQTMRVVFLSPKFLFRTELGPVNPGIGGMDPYDRASALSYTLYDGPPDQLLMQAAQSGELNTTSQLSSHVRRLLSSSNTGSGIVEFLGEYFGTNEVVKKDIDEVIYPEWTPVLAQGFLDSAKAFYEEIMFRDDASLSTLLTADYAMVNNTIAPYYGVSPTGGNNYVKRTLPSGQRTGILSQTAFLMPISGFSVPDITIRGHYIREHIMCVDMPEPPANVPDLPQNTGLSRRERLATIHAANDVCWACHELMDPIGYAFENYDNIGRWRLTELFEGKKLPLDSTGTIAKSSMGDINVANSVELGKTLAVLPEVQECFVGGIADYLAGGHDDEVDACRVDRANSAFSGDIADVIVQLLSDENYYLRKTIAMAAVASPTIEAENYNSTSPVSPFTTQNIEGRVVMVWPDNGNTANTTPADGTSGQLFYNVVAESSSLTLYAMVNFTNATNDSVHYKLEGSGDDWAALNGQVTAGFKELKVGSWMGLNPGQTYVLKIQRREDGAMLDTFRIEGGGFSQ